MGEFYNGNNLLSMLDANGQKPEVYICSSNRSAGKTTFFAKYFVNRFLTKNEKFVLLYRFKYELDGVADKFFKDVSKIFFPNLYMTSKTKLKGVYHELYIGGIGSKKAPTSCGYAISLNDSDNVKKYSHLFSDAHRIMFDEFQSESNIYCDHEINKFMSIHTSLARGNGEQVKYLPVIMISNPVSTVNPYYIALGISERLKPNTHFLRGDGFVLEQAYIESAGEKQKKSGFNRAFANAEYLAYSAQNEYLNDDTTFIAPIQLFGKSFKYLATLKYNKKTYSIKYVEEADIFYCDDSFDDSFKLKIAVTLQDHGADFYKLSPSNQIIQTIKQAFDNGDFRFKNLQCKECILKLISY